MIAEATKLSPTRMVVPHSCIEKSLERPLAVATGQDYGQISQHLSFQNTQEKMKSDRWIRRMKSDGNPASLSSGQVG
jgi:hypothetical protein